MIQFDDHIFQMGWNHQLGFRFAKKEQHTRWLMVVIVTIVSWIISPKNGGLKNQLTGVTLRLNKIPMENGPWMKMYFLLEMGMSFQPSLCDRLPEGNLFPPGFSRWFREVVSHPNRIHKTGILYIESGLMSIYVLWEWGFLLGVKKSLQFPWLQVFVTSSCHTLCWSWSTTAWLGHVWMYARTWKNHPRKAWLAHHQDFGHIFL